MDWRVFLFAAGAGACHYAAARAGSAAPGSRPELLPVLQAGAVTRTEARAPLARRAAIWLQIAVSFALLVSTGALVRSFINTRTQSIGLTRDQVLLAWTQEPEAAHARCGRRRA